MVSISIDENQTCPLLLSIITAWGVVLPPGRGNSLNVSVLGSNRPILPASYSQNHTMPCASIFRRRGQDSGVGCAYLVSLPVLASTLPIFPSFENSVNQTFSSLSRESPYAF